MSAAVGTCLFDLGNTRLKYAALREDGSLGEVAAVAHAGRAGPDLFAMLPGGAVAVVSSVAAQDVTDALLEKLRTRFGRCLLARTQDRFDGVQIAYPRPERLGVDRFLALLAARVRAPGAALVVGVGTALTIDLLDAHGRHRGGRIAPSPALMRQMLHQRVPALAETGGDYVEFAQDTPEALASGCEGAALALVERSRRQALDLLGADPLLLLHGGGGDALRSRLADAQWTPQLVLEGLARWARLQA